MANLSHLCTNAVTTTTFNDEARHTTAVKKRTHHCRM